jgi:hypothetical protein
VCLDHSFQNILNSERLSLTSEVISNSENGTQIVRRMTPFAGSQSSEAKTIGIVPTFCSEETIIEIQPTNNGSYIESPTNWIQLVVGPRNLRSYDLF